MRPLFPNPAATDKRAPKPPLCKGRSCPVGSEVLLPVAGAMLREVASSSSRCHGEAVTATAAKPPSPFRGGIVEKMINHQKNDCFNNPSVSSADSSLYTREPPLKFNFQTRKRQNRPLLHDTAMGGFARLDLRLGGSSVCYFIPTQRTVPCVRNPFLHTAIFCHA